MPAVGRSSVAAGAGSNGKFQNVNDDYVLDTDYTWGYYGGQSPAAMAYAARLNGVEPPSLNGEFRYLELGCGNGVTANILASMFPHGEFVAADLNADHVKNGSALAATGQLSNIRFIETSFAELAESDDDPFDFISLHGVYSWVGETVRNDIIKVLSKHLKSNGLVYVSYNAMPGWAALSPLRQLMVTYAENKSGSSIERARASIRYLEFLRDNNAAYFVQYPECGAFVDNLLKDDLKYVVHEYFNASWEPQYFSEVATDMSEAELRFCGTTVWPKNYLDLCIPGEFQEILLSADSDFTRETHKSLILNERFRTDIYSRNSATLSGRERAGLFSELYFSSVVPEEEIARKIRVGPVDVKYDADIYDVLIPILCDGETSVEALWDNPDLARYSESFIAESVNNLVPGGQFQPMLSPSRRRTLVPFDDFSIRSDINRELVTQRLLSDGGCFQASPVLGTALRLDLLSGLIVLGTDAKGPDGAVDHAVDTLIRVGQTLQIDGKLIEDIDECRAMLVAEQKKFNNRGLGLLEKFGVIEPR